MSDQKKRDDPQKKEEGHRQRAEKNVPVEEQENKGAKLKKIREEKGISLQTIHEATKIPLDALRAIEEGYTVRTLSEFYYRSFVKIYANYLDVDVSEVLEGHKKEQLPKHIKQEPEFEVHILDRLDKFFTKRRKQQIFYACAVLVGLFLVLKFVVFLVNRPPSQKKVKVQAPAPPVREQDNTEEQPAEATRQEAATTPAPPSSVQGQESQQPSVETIDKEVVLTVRARKSSWLRVKTDGNIVFQSTLGAGDVETWTADGKIEITGRNIGDLEFELNGKLIGSLGRSGRRAKGLVVTSEGLSVTR